MENLIKLHNDTFGIDPYMIGMFWRDKGKEIDNIQQAIKDNKPYNEYNLLSKEEQKAFDSGELVF